VGDWQLQETYTFRGEAVRCGSLGDGPPIVLVHGTPFSSYVWHRIAPHLADRYRVYFFDLLGYGRSAKRDGQDVSLGVQNVLLGELLDHWGLDRPDVVGHDFGGTTALRAHLLDGLDFRTLTLIDPVALSPWGIGLDRHVRGSEEVFRALPRDIHEAILSTYVRGAINRALPHNELVPYLQPWLDRDGQAGFYRQMVQFDRRFTDEIEQRYSEIRCPTLILWGEQDRWLPIEHGHRLANLINHAHLKVVAGAGHLVQEDAPEAIVGAIHPFLAAHAQALSTPVE
jgi:pimeloyl-ACP methyl ester carboxylesterase